MFNSAAIFAPSNCGALRQRRQKPSVENRRAEATLRGPQPTNLEGDESVELAGEFDITRNRDSRDTGQLSNFVDSSLNWNLELEAATSR